MLSKTEFRILDLLLGDLTKEYSIIELSRKLKLAYPQVHRAVKSLVKKKLVFCAEKGRTLMINIKLIDVRKEYINVELGRYEKTIQKYKDLAVIYDDLKRITPVQFVCIVFGSYAKLKTGKSSDIDLLFVIPDEYNYKIFEKQVKTNLTLSKIDINITTEKGLIEMWQKPEQLNVGNEILKNHVILRGAEAFFNLRRKYYGG